MIISVKVKPGSRKETLRIENDVIIIQIKARPVDGKANDALIAYLADILGISKSQIAIKSGHTARLKRIELPDVAAQNLMKLGARGKDD